MITQRELEAEFATEEELDLDAEFVDVSGTEDDTNIYELKALRLSILLDFYAQDTPIVADLHPEHCGDDPAFAEEGWHAQDPWFSRMPALPVAEIDQ